MSTTTTTASMKARKPKWHPTPPPPPSPKILNLPRRTRRKQPKTSTRKQPITTTKPHSSHHHYNPLELHQNHYYYYNKKGKLESLFGQEREFSRSDTMPIVLLNSSSSPSSFSRRERVEDDEGIVMEELSGDECGESGGGGFEVEKWKFQAEILRAECNFLRMEREFALKKLERNRKQMEGALRSAVQTLLNGREKIFEGKNETAVLKEEIEDLAENLKKLQKNSRAKDVDLRNCNNFDKEACRLQQQLEKLGGLSDEKCLKEMQEIVESSLTTDLNCDIDRESHVTGQKSENKSTNNVQVELLRSKMEGLSMGMLDRMEEEYGSLLSTTADSSVASSASTSKRTECSDLSAVLSGHLYQETMPSEENKCSGRCKAIVRRIVEQVRAETEQWSQMQAMLGQVRKEMEELQVSRDFWEDRALKSDREIQALQSSVQEWKEKAFNFEAKANELETEVSKLKAELECSRAEPGSEQNREVMSPQHLPLVLLGKYLEKENCTINSNLKVSHQNDDPKHRGETARETMNAAQDNDATTMKDLPPLTLGKQLAKEKRLLLRRLKENRHNNAEEGSKQEFSADGRRKAHASTHGLVAPKRLPFRDIGNSSPLAKQNTRAVFPLHSPKPCKTGESF